MARQIDGGHVARRALIACALLAGTAAFGRAQATPAVAEEVPWPRTVRAGSATLTVYHPQVDTWDGFTLAARYAVKVEATRNSSPRFGVVTISARTLTDKSTRMVTIEHTVVSETKFPTASRDDAKRWAEAVAQSDLAGESRLIALDRLEAALAATEFATTTSLPPLGVEPPRIIFSSRPAILVYVDGDPQYRPVADTHLERVLNTRMLILRDASGAHYLKVFDGWMRASSFEERWTVVSNPPAELAIALDKMRKARLVDELSGRTIPGDEVPLLSVMAPVIYVATTPTELIVTDGPQNWTMVNGLRVFYLLNTTGRVLKSGQDHNTYVLVAGRWFRARQLDGPWTYVPANALPTDFAHIPDFSPIENVKASIAGTKQARDAAIAAMIPQTVALSLHGAQLIAPRTSSESPRFKADRRDAARVCRSTRRRSVVRVGGSALYAIREWRCVRGLRRTRSTANGRWPPPCPTSVYTIPPTSPLYYVTFARVYASAGDTVFVGYTPGYHGTYVDPVTGVAFFGTGFAYQPWLAQEWYGAPVTYGFGADPTYTPWTGWSVALGLGWAWNGAVLANGWGLGAYPWWGPWGWGWAYGPAEYPWYPAWGTAPAATDAVVWGPGGWTAYSADIYRRWGDRAAGSRLGAGLSVWTDNPWTRLVGLSYNSHTGVAISGQHGAIESVRDDGLRDALATRGCSGNTDAGDIISARLEVSWAIFPRTTSSTSAVLRRTNHPANGFRLEQRRAKRVDSWNASRSPCTRDEMAVSTARRTAVGSVARRTVGSRSSPLVRFRRWTSHFRDRPIGSCSSAARRPRASWANDARCCCASRRSTCSAGSMQSEVLARAEQSTCASLHRHGPRSNGSGLR